MARTGPRLREVGWRPAPPPFEIIPADSMSASPRGTATQVDGSVEQLLSALRVTGDLFPLPPIPQPPRTSNRSRRAQHRWARAMEVWTAADRARVALYGLRTTPPCADSGMSPAGRISQGSELGAGGACFFCVCWWRVADWL